MKFKLLLISLLLISFTCNAQISVNDSIIKIKNLLGGTWVDSLRPYITISFKDSELFFTTYDTNNNIDTVKYYYQVDTNCNGLYLKTSSTSYYIYARKLDHIDIDTIRRIEDPPHNEMYISIEYLDKSRLYLYMEFSYMEVTLIKKK